MQRTIEQMLECLRLFYFWMSIFFSFIWNQWYACSNNFYRRSWKATCFSELLLWFVYRDLSVYSQFVDLSQGGGHVEDNKEGIMLKALFLSNITDVAQNNTASATLADLKLVHFVVVFTLKRVDSLCVVYFTHGFLQKKGDDNNIGSSLSHGKRKKQFNNVSFSKGSFC